MIFQSIFAFVKAQVGRYFDWQIKMGKVGWKRTETKDRRNWLIVTHTIVLLSSVRMKLSSGKNNSQILNIK